MFPELIENLIYYTYINHMFDFRIRIQLIQLSQWIKTKDGGKKVKDEREEKGEIENMQQCTQRQSKYIHLVCYVAYQ